MAIKIAGTEVINDNKELVLAKLAEIDSSISVTAVDVFVYDTSKDSDGGAWRKRTQGTSWYNETLNTATRGSRREFPAVAVIVAESRKVTIYDGDDPALPMWMVFTSTGGSSYHWYPADITGFGTTIYDGLNSAVMQNGKMVLGGAYLGGNRWDGCYQIDFLKETSTITNGTVGYFFERPIGLAYRNVVRTPYAYDRVPTTNYLVASPVNDVAMTVLPNAPIDPATGLPVPTIAVATAGGVSVIKDDGTVVDITSTSVSGVLFTEEQNLVTTRSSVVNYGPLPTADVAESTWRSSFVWPDSQNVRTLASAVSKVTAIGSEILADGRPSGLTRVTPYDPANGMVAYTTSTYNTGWMNGDIKGAFLSDTDDTDLVGTELVTNGTFDTDTDWTKGTGWTIGSGAATHAAGTSSNITQALTLTPNATYVVSYDITAVTAGTVRAQFGGTVVGTSNGSVGSYAETFVAPSGSVDLILSAGASFDGTIDNISVKLADADRSVNNNGLIINGTVTRSPVATGADLVAYSGFSASNYLEGVGHGIGSGDFSVVCWYKPANTGTDVVVNFVNSDFSVERSPFVLVSGNFYHGFINQISGTNTGMAIPTGVWSLLEISRSSGVLSASVNGKRQYSASYTEDFSATVPNTLVGLNRIFSSPADGSMALFRISATAPTAEQIAKIYEDEKVLFQENAQATLYGSSDAVTALAHDDATNLLHVGTSAGRSVFQGLRRVENTTTAVGTAISAANNMIVEE